MDGAHLGFSFSNEEDKPLPIVCRSKEKVDQKIERLFGKLK